VASFRDELFAYLMYQHYRSSKPFASDELLLRYAGKEEAAEYQVLVVLTDDFAGSVSRVAELYADRKIEAFDWVLVPHRSLAGLKKPDQTLQLGLQSARPQENGRSFQGRAAGASSMVYPV
jgi:hypothetical protein